MPIVNLIQEQRNARRAQEQQGRLILLVIAAAGVVSFLTAGFFTFEKVRHTLRYGELQRLKEELTPKMDELDKIQGSIGGLQVRMDTLKDAEKDTVRWSGLLTYLGTNTPDGVLVSDVRSNMAPDATIPTAFTVTGLSVDQNRVADFMLRLQSAPQLQGVVLRYTQEKVGPNNRSTQFELGASLEGTGKPAAAAGAMEKKS
jgi:Tfp pilus assembly protein PilN